MISGLPTQYCWTHELVYKGDQCPLPHSSVLIGRVVTPLYPPIAVTPFSPEAVATAWLETPGVVSILDAFHYQEKYEEFLGRVPDAQRTEVDTLLRELTFHSEQLTPVEQDIVEILRNTYEGAEDYLVGIGLL